MMRADFVRSKSGPLTPADTHDWYAGAHLGIEYAFILLGQGMIACIGHEPRLASLRSRKSTDFHDKHFTG
jgi:hypothetical protein